MRSNKCPKCPGSMAEGFVLDENHGWRRPSNWVAGAPVRSWFTGTNLRGKQKIPVQTWRCTRCGYLESYAVS